MTPTGRAQQLARALHEYSCYGWQEGYCDHGSAHSRLSLTLARDALAAPDPAEVIHDATCEALRNSTITCCPTRTRHIAWLTEEFGHHWTLQVAP